jgi:hypothetical protein
LFASVHVALAPGPPGAGTPDGGVADDPTTPTVETVSATAVDPSSVRQNTRTSRETDPSPVPR